MIGLWSGIGLGDLPFSRQELQADAIPLGGRETVIPLIGAGNQRAQQIQANVYGDGSIINYLNINAFQAPATAPKGVYATTRPFTVSGPNVMNIDLTLSRNFNISEHRVLQFRAEAFNLTNSVMFGPPTGALNSANFGRINPQIQSSAPGSTSTARQA